MVQKNAVILLLPVSPHIMVMYSI